MIYTYIDAIGFIPSCSCMATYFLKYKQFPLQHCTMYYCKIPLSKIKSEYK